MNDLVSIITPNYNGSAYIVETIESVLAQSYQNWEMLIVDDHSSDNSLDIVNSYQDSRIKILKNDKKGAASARNVALRAAKGRYIAFLDNDDLWLPEKLEKQLKFMQEGNLALSYTHYQRFNDAGENLGLHQPQELNLNYQRLLKGCPIGCLTVIYDKDKVGDVLMPEVKMRNDYALWLKILKQGHIATLMPEVLAKYRVRAGSLSGNKLKAAMYQFKLLFEVENLGLLKTCYYFSFYALENVMRRLMFKLK